jgi:transcriptional regulator with XRE-family HTH domain
MKRIRQRAGMTQSQAASLMGLSKSGYVKIESGARKLSDRHIRTAMKAFDVSEREILANGSETGVAHRSAGAAKELTPAEALAFANTCVMFLDENAGGELGLEWLEALIEVVRGRGNDDDLQNLEILRAKVRTVSNIARAGLLARNQRET